MNSLISGFVIAIVGIIIGAIAGFVVDCIAEEKWDIDELNRLRDKGYNYFIKDDEIIVYKKIKNRELVRELNIIIEGERRANFVAEMAKEKMKEEVRID